MFFKAVRFTECVLIVSSLLLASPNVAVSLPEETDGTTIQQDSTPVAVQVEVKDENFPEPAELKPNVAFWVDVYTKYSETEAIIHDNVDLNIRYEVINIQQTFGKGSHRYLSHQLSKRKAYYSALLTKLAKQSGECLTPDECRVAALFDNTREAWRYRAASENLRVQYGLSNRFRDGLVNSGQYIEGMRGIFASYGLPLDLLALPHVESSFNVAAYSRVGAAGIWQFMRSTGRHFMKINGTVDERRDPLLATEAAARFLRANYAEIGCWPLAVTSYNHGKNGMLRAQRIYGNDIAAIVRHYHGPAFGFASRNFYSEFLAARKILQEPERYFGAVNFKSPIRFEMVRVEGKKVRQLAGSHSIEEIASLNPALHKQVLRGNKPIPNGYLLRVPEGTALKMGALPVEPPTPDTRDATQENAPPENTLVYEVKKGDSLLTIARKFNTTPDYLRDLNDFHGRRLSAGRKIYVPAETEGNAPTDETARDATAASEARRAVKAVYTPPAKNGVPPSPVPPATMEAVTDIPVPVVDNYRMSKADTAAGVLTVLPEETIGYYAEWARCSVKDILSLNRMKKVRNMQPGRDLSIPLNSVSREQFEQNRFQFHHKMFNTFFASYRVNKVDSRVLRRGQSIWKICAQSEELPMWLLSIFNRGKRLDKLLPGEVVRIPVVEKRES